MGVYCFLCGNKYCENNISERVAFMCCKCGVDEYYEICYRCLKKRLKMMMHIETNLIANIIDLIDNKLNTKNKDSIRRILNLRLKRHLLNKASYDKKYGPRLRCIQDSGDDDEVEQYRYCKWDPHNELNEKFKSLEINDNESKIIMSERSDTDSIEEQEQYAEQVKRENEKKKSYKKPKKSIKKLDEPNKCGGELRPIYYRHDDIKLLIR